MGTDFHHWAVVAYKDDTGLGRMAADIRAILGLGRHLVIPSERLANHDLKGVGELWLRPDAAEEEVRSRLEGLKGLIFLEQHGWHPRLLPLAREMGVATVCVPMWEWFKGTDHQWAGFDLFVCPTHFTEKILGSYGWKNTVVLPWTLRLDRFRPRRVEGPGLHFIHNAGLVDHDDRKGTRDTIQAFKRVKRPDIRLLVRMQKPAPLPELDGRIEVRVGNLPDPAELYWEGDAAVQPSKMEGLGFMVIEPVCCGLPVITTDYPPMNEFVRQPELRCATRWFKRRAFASQWIRHAHLRLPSVRDLALRIGWAASHDLSEISRSNRSWAERTFAPEHLVRQWKRALLPLGGSTGKC
jgi:glycosyltransferase involved in cell wall biosynthesis